MSHEPAFHTPLLHLITQSWLLHAVTAAIKLRVPDAMSDRPQTAAELAERLNLHEPALRRLLQALVANRFVRQHQGGYVLTPSGEDLRSDRRDTLVPFALFDASAMQRRGWDSLDKALQDGTPGVEHALGESMHTYLSKHPDMCQLFNRAMQAVSCRTVEAVAKHRDLSHIETFVDIGGGTGALAAELLTHNPRLRGTVFDVPTVRHEAERTLYQAKVSERGQFIGADLFETPPPPADLYIFQGVLTHWEDTRATQLLQQVSQAMRTGASLWIVEPLMTAENDAWATLVDMQMMAMTSGHVRTEAEYVKLLQAVDLEMIQVRPVADTCVLAAMPVS